MNSELTFGLVCLVLGAVGGVVSRWYPASARAAIALAFLPLAAVLMNLVTC